MRAILATLLLLTLAACASGPTPDSPKANLLARAAVLAKNDRSITIRHSKWGQSVAYQWAADHCAKLNKLAVPAGETQDFGTNATTTWRCE
jgi:hypothetical protein